MQGNTAGDALEAAIEALAAAGCETARLDAELLLAQATGWDRAKLTAEPDARLPVGASREFAEMVRRRVRREPVAYILGRKGFRRIELLVDRRVLIPRPETELLVELALEAAPTEVLDVGTGSGAIALAVADELEDVRVTAIDTSFDAVRVAQANTDRLGLTERVDVVPGPSSLTGAEPDDRAFDLLLQTSLRERGRVAGSGARDPGASRAGARRGPDRPGGDRSACRRAPGSCAATVSSRRDRRRPGRGRLEAGQAAGYTDVEVRSDLAGHDRVVIGR